MPKPQVGWCLGCMYAYVACDACILRCTYSKGALGERKPGEVPGRRRSSLGNEGGAAAAAAGNSSNNSSTKSSSRWWYCIRIRMRHLQRPQELLALPTQLGIFFHELAHLRYNRLCSFSCLPLLCFFILWDFGLGLVSVALLLLVASSVFSLFGFPASVYALVS